MRPSSAGNAMLEGRSASRQRRLCAADTTTQSGPPHCQADMGALSPEFPGLGALQTSFGPPQP